jgi:hypothetical protein
VLLTHVPHSAVATLKKNLLTLYQQYGSVAKEQIQPMTVMRRHNSMMAMANGELHSG